MCIHHDPQIYLAIQLFSIVCTYVYCVYVLNVFKKKINSVHDFTLRSYESALAAVSCAKFEVIGHLND